MNPRRLIALCVAVLIPGPSTPLLAEQARAVQRPKYRLRWSDLAPLITGHSISTALADSTRISGTVIAVEPDSMALRIRKTSDAAAWPKGRALVPRVMLSGMRVTKKTGYTWRFVGTAIGGAISALIGIPAALCCDGNGRASAIAAGLIALPPAIGYFAGRASDHKVMDIELAPNDALMPTVR